MYEWQVCVTMVGVCQASDDSECWGLGWRYGWYCRIGCTFANLGTKPGHTQWANEEGLCLLQPNVNPMGRNGRYDVGLLDLFRRMWKLWNLAKKYDAENLTLGSHRSRIRWPDKSAYERSWRARFPIRNKKQGQVQRLVLKKPECLKKLKGRWTEKCLIKAVISEAKAKRAGSDGAFRIRMTWWRKCSQFSSLERLPVSSDQLENMATFAYF